MALPKLLGTMMLRSRSRILMPSSSRSLSSNVGPGLAVTVSSLRPEVQVLHKQVTQFVRDQVLPLSLFFHRTAR